MTDYSGNKKVGNGILIITGRGKYAGTEYVEFKVVPAKPVIRKLTPKRKALTVSIAKSSTAYGTSRFQIRYKIKGTKKWTTRTVGSSKTQTLKKLKTGKRYTVQVRAKGVYSGPWSTAKTSGRIK